MGTTVTVDAALLRRWSAGAVAALRRASGRLDADNVFPVPDGDTGTNLLLTVAEAADSLAALVAPATPAEGADPAAAGEAVPVRLAAQALMRGALVGARGSSGVIVSQYLRGLLGSLDVAPGAGSATLDAAAVARALREASDAAYGAVGEPVEGTVLTVAREVARGAVSTGPAPVDALRAGLVAGRAALAVTPTQLPALRRAGVLDAGAAGLLVVLGALLDAVAPDDTRDGPPWAVLDASPSVPSSLAGTCDGAHDHDHDHAHDDDHDHDHRATPHDVDSSPDGLRERHGGEFEVMYVVAVDHAEPAPAHATASDAPGDPGRDDPGAALRTALMRVGDAVAVVGGDRLWQAHVHTDDPVAAVHAATVAGGAASQVRVRHLASQSGVHGAHRPVVGLVAVTRAPGLAPDLARTGAVVVLAPTSGTAGDELRRAVEDTGADVVVVLAVAGSVDGVPTGRGLAGEPRAVVLDDLAEVQVVAGAATSVTLEPATAEDAVARLTAAVHGVRRVDVTDGVGGAGHAEHVLAPTRALLAADGSLVTALVGRDAPPDLGDRLVEGLAASHPAVDVVVLATGAEGAGVEIGVE